MSVQIDTEVKETINSLQNKLLSLNAKASEIRSLITGLENICPKLVEVADEHGTHTEYQHTAIDKNTNQLMSDGMRQSIRSELLTQATSILS